MGSNSSGTWAAWGSQRGKVMIAGSGGFVNTRGNEPSTACSIQPATPGIQGIPESAALLQYDWGNDKTVRYSRQSRGLE